MFLPPTRAVALLSIAITSICALDIDESIYQPRPYTINVSSSFVEVTRLKASAFRPPQDISAPAWFDGPPTSIITSLANYWAEDYDWYAEQDRINSNFSHYTITIPPVSAKYNSSLDVHFIHQRSARKDAIPMLMLHGWPSTSLEWEKVIPGLVDPKNQSEPAFHIIAPDIPGFGFSPAPTAPGLDASAFAAVFARLMQQLGYSQYALYSTDLGYLIALKMVVEFQAQIINHISDFYITFPSESDLARYVANETTEEENAFISSSNAYLQNYSGYADIHSTLPLSLAHALTDSPVGFLAWVYQLIYLASDRNHTETELITKAMVLYIPGPYGNIRAYKETFAVQNFTPDQNKTVPTSVLQFGGNNVYPELGNFSFVPRDWVERTANLTYFARHSERGGHFPAESAPELVLADIRAIFS